MRRVVVQMQVSIDGYTAGPDGSIDWIFPAFDEEFTERSVALLWSAGTHVMGAETGRDLAGYWPNPTEERDLPFAAPMNEIAKVIFSKSIDHVDWNDTRIERGDVAEVLPRMKQEDGKDILVHGGMRFVHSLVRLGLVDEFQIMVHPVALGGGNPFFPELPEPLRLQLIEARPFKSGAVLHVSAPLRAGQG